MVVEQQGDVAPLVVGLAGGHEALPVGMVVVQGQGAAQRLGGGPGLARAGLGQSGEPLAQVLVAAQTAQPPQLAGQGRRSEEHTSELQSRPHLVCRLLLEKKKKTTYK